MSHWRDYRGSRGSLFDSMEGGDIRAPSSYKNSEIYEHENEQALNGLEDRVSILKRLTTDIHDEVGFHNRMLDGLGKDMDSARGVMSGTVARFKRVFETKSGRNMVTIVTSFIVIGLLVYYLIR
ncbi:hypothetical protein O6H91_19G032900 [Diphasiastrum complanatum]|uniref:Uncharacterized protein n=1 Tax=Diphasiastrum complanatum TaxID=34168 RepID=A0ACC2ATX7_DIPCM|nr:hypothetical protein O6H91_19G032900 [Diphasiastrum complanatum]